LREIAAASDFDFVAVEPRPAAKGAAGKRAKGSKKTANAGRWRLGVLWRYRTPALGALVLGGLLAAIVVNAVFLQHGRHPAPLFGSTFKIEPPRPPARPAGLDTLLNERMPGLPLQPVNPSQDAAFSAPMVNEPPAAASQGAAQPAPTKKSRDLIGVLIDTGVAPPAASGRSVLAAQRALQKLGAPVKPDGDYGAATRKAVEGFQRENHLPVTGELNAKTRRLLAARSGLPVD
jgi:hypothetical protein